MAPGTVFTTLCNISQDRKVLPVTNTLAYLSHLYEVCQISLGRKVLPVTNTLAYLSHLCVTKNMKCCEYSSRDHIHNNSFSSKHTNGSNKLECYILLGRKVLLVTNTLAYLSHLYVTKNMKCCEYSSRDHIHNSSFSFKHTNGSNKLEWNISLGRKDLPVTSKLAYLSHSQITKKMKSCEYDS